MRAIFYGWIALLATLIVIAGCARFWQAAEVIRSIPTPTARATATPEPTSTPKPTPTVRPSATPYPTYTPPPVSTPRQSPTNRPVTVTPTGTATPTPFSAADGDIVWLGPDVSQWGIVESIRAEASYRLERVCVIRQGGYRWPVRTVSGVKVVASFWVVLELDGTTYAATFEYLRPGQMCKAITSLNGEHIQNPEIPENWTPSPGDEIGLMVSGLARGGVRNVTKRTEIYYITWPRLHE